MSDAFWMAFFAAIVSIAELICTLLFRQRFDKFERHVNGFIPSDPKEKK